MKFYLILRRHWITKSKNRISKYALYLALHLRILFDSLIQLPSSLYIIKAKTRLVMKDVEPLKCLYNDLYDK